MANLTQAQAAAVAHRGSTLLVAAAAGSGKTMVLVERLLSQVMEGHDITEFLMITYTKAAAAELRRKIAARFGSALAETPDDAHLRRQLSLLYLAQISTIHSYCGDLLRQNAYARDLPPDFRVAEETQAALLRRSVLTQLLAEQYEHPGAGFLALSDTLGAGRSDSRLVEVVDAFYGTLCSHAYPERWLDACRAQLQTDAASADETPWGACILAQVRRTALAQSGQLARAMELCHEDPILDQKYLPALTQLRDAVDQLSHAESWDAACSLAQLPSVRFGVASKADEGLKQRITTLRDGCKKAIAKAAEALYDSSAAVLADLRLTVPATLALFDLTQVFSRRYRQEKRRRGLLDFSDLEHESIALLTDAYTGKPTAIAEDESRRWQEILVDEYQDCNEVQDTIFRAVSKQERNLFFVGDVKQSIYRFRLADPGIFLQKYRAFSQEPQPGEPRKILLSCNFRSRAPVLEACNHVFRTVMSEELGELTYGDEEALIPGAAQPPLPDEPLVELHVISGGAEAQARVAREADFVAARIRDMLDAGTQVTGADGAPRPMQPGDVVILLRSPRSCAEEYIGALRAQGIAAVGDRGGDLLETTEAMVLLSTLRAIDNPHQDIPLVAAMASPIFGFTAEELAQMRPCADGDFIHAVRAYAEQDEKTAEFLSLLSEFRTLSQTLSLPELIWTLIRRTHMEELFGALEGGAQRQRNLLRLYEEALGNHSSLTAFLDAMELRRGKDGIEPAGESEAGGAVRLMSIHKSKGLEFPVVFVSDLARRFNLTDLNAPVLCHPKLGVGTVAVDLEQMQQYPTLAKTAIRQVLLTETLSEQLRVLYVAMTRASERLILTYCEDDAQNALQKAAYSSYPADPYQAAQAANMGHWVLMAALLRPESGALRSAIGWEGGESVCDGAPWRIAYHDYTAQEQTSVPPAALPAERMPTQFPLLDFVDPHAAAAATPSKLTATQLKGRDLDEEAAEGAAQLPAAQPIHFERPRFDVERSGLTPAERGIAAHLFMQYANYAACGDEGGVRAELARLVTQEFLSAEQADAVKPETVLAFFRSPLGQRVQAANELIREFKFSLLAPAERFYPGAGAGEEVLLQGVIDCALLEEDGITVIDFKTDRLRPGDERSHAARYRGQLQTYVYALERIYGKPVRRCVLWFFATGNAVEL